MGYTGNTNSFNVNSFNKTVNTTVADDKPQVLRWLSSLQPQQRHEHLRGNRLDDVGQWIFQTGEFRRWNAGEDGSAHPVLFCHGDPGVGKTYLSSLVIDHFSGGGPSIIVAGLFCDYLDRNEQTVSGVLGAILKQLVGGRSIPKDIRRAFEDAKEHFGGVGPRVPELVKMLKTAIAQRQRVVICIDGLDESLPEHRTGLLSSLQAIVRELPNIRLFLAGRPFIRSEVERHFPYLLAISVSPTKEDIEDFLRMKLDEDTEPDAMDDCLRADIMETIPKKISEIFLLVSLSIEAILGETTVHRRREKLRLMSKGQDVGDAYSATLERIQTQKKDRSRLGMEAIMWVAHSQRPLEPGELCQALGVEIGSKDLENDNSPSIRTILNCALGLVTVDSSSSTVRLVHFTLQEYILANPTLFLSPHSAIAEVCLTYLNFTCIEDLSSDLHSPPLATPFLEYAASYWGAHARRETNETVVLLAVKLLVQLDRHVFRELYLLKDYRLRKCFDIRDDMAGFNGLHGAAFLGVFEIVVSLLELKKWDINATAGPGLTALALAARNGHSGVVRVLLERNDVNPNLADDMGRTPLSWAAERGYERVVKMLLKRDDVNPDMVDKVDGLKPSSWASLQGHGGVVAMLLERGDVRPDTADRSGRTVLSWAAGNGDERLVKILLERSDVNPDPADKCGRTPLSWAAAGGHLEVVKTLLERNDVNPNSPDMGGRTPFLWAAMCGHQEIVELILGRNNFNPDTVGGGGRTPFSWAAMYGHGEVVRVLLQRGDVNPDRVDRSGRAPFSYAAENGHQKVVKMLLERNDVNPDMPDGCGRTPFSWAAIYGHKEIAEILLAQNNVNPDMADENGRTPFSWAAQSGHGEIVEMLLKRDDVNLDMADGSGRTPLFWAITSGSQRVVRLIEEWDDLAANSELRGQSFQPLANERSEPSAHPVQRIRRF